MMKRNNIFNVFMVVSLCIMLLAVNMLLPGTAATAQAAGKSISSLSISGITTKEYTGKAITQNPVIKDGAKTLKKGTDYTLSYKNNSEVGTATVVIKGKSNYTGSVNKSFQITPAVVKSLTAKSVIAGTAELSWELGRGVDGYQVYYSESKNGKYTKLATVDTNAYNAKLGEGKTFYIKVRAYAKVNGKECYGEYCEAVKVTVLKEKNKINIIDSGKAYGNYLKISDIPEEITKQMKYLYPTGVLTELSIQYVDKTSGSSRWVDFFSEVTEKNNPVMGDNEKVGYYSFKMISSDVSTTVYDHYKAMTPDSDKDYSGEKVLQYGVFLIDVKENPAVTSDGMEKNYVDAKEDGYLTIIAGGAY